MASIVRIIAVLAVIGALGIAYLSDNSAAVEQAKARFSLSDEQAGLIDHCSKLLRKRSRNFVVRKRGVVLQVTRELGCGCIIKRGIGRAGAERLAAAKAAFDLFAGRELRSAPMPASYISELSSQYGAELNETINTTTKMQSAMKICTLPAAYLTEAEGRQLVHGFKNRPNQKSQPWHPYHFEIGGMKGYVDIALDLRERH